MFPFNISPSGGSDETELAKGDVFEVLSNRRRRYLMHALKRLEEPVAVADLSTYVAAWEMGIEPEAVEHDDRRSLYMTLRRTHLPKLEEKNVVHFDESENVVRSTDALDDFDIYVEALTDNEMPWGLYYLGLAAVAVALLLAVATETPGFGTVEPLQVGVFTALAFGLSAVVQKVIDGYNRLGTSEKPPELRRAE